MDEFLPIIKEKRYIIHKAHDSGDRFGMDVILFKSHHTSPLERKKARPKGGVARLWRTPQSAAAR